MTAERQMVPYSQARLPFGVLRGPAVLARIEARKLERRGDIKVLGQGVAYTDRGRPMVAIPYMPIRTLRQIRRRALLRAGGWTVMALGGLGSLLAAAWQARVVLAYLGAGAVLVALSVAFLLTRGNHAGACTGLHCPGCRG